jgi:hypothetical protein
VPWTGISTSESAVNARSLPTRQHAGGSPRHF